jgi:hypothetical protein
MQHYSIRHNYFSTSNLGIVSPINLDDDRNMLAVTLRYFAGGSSYDICLAHGVSHSNLSSPWSRGHWRFWYKVARKHLRKEKSK